VFRRPIVVAPIPAPPAPQPLHRLARMARWLAVRVAVVAALAAIGLVIAAQVWTLPAPSNEARSSGVNAAWVARTWVEDPHTDDEHAQLTDRLRSAQVSDVFVPVGLLDGAGAVSPEGVPRAAAFIDAVHRAVPGARVQAHLGHDPALTGQSLPLHDRAVRDGIVATAGAFLDLGFDGIHYDIRPVRSGDRGMLDVLDRTRGLTAPRGAVLSLVVEQVQAHRLVASVMTPLDPTYAEPDAVYLSALADRVDQLVVLVEDSWMPTSASFAAYVAWQTGRTARIVSNRVTLFVSVPATDADARAETPAAALHGLRRGLDSLGGPAALAQPIGAAIRADGTTADDGWRTITEEWVSRS
jgi:hypothetical protein